MKECCKVSVIIPVYNVEKYLQKCLDSVVCQTLENYEIICVEDCSTDNSMELLKAYAKRYPMIRIIEYGCNKGQAYARNRGMEAAKGKYLYFMDSDDTLVDNSRLAWMYTRAEEKQLDVLLFDAAIEFETQRLRGMRREETFMAKCEYSGLYDGETFFSQCYRNDDYRCVVWRQFWNREFLLSNKLFFDEETSPHEDEIFTFKAIMKVNRLKCEKEVVYNYNYRELSATTTGFSLKRLKSYCLVYFYSLEYLSNCTYSKDAEEAIILYLHDAKKHVKEGAIELIQKGVDVYQLDFANPLYNLWFKLLLVEDYMGLTKLMDSQMYQMCVDTPPIIYGAGLVGKAVIRMLDDFGIAGYALAVTAKSGKADTAHNKKLYELRELSADLERPVIIAVKEFNKEELASYAKSIGFQNLLFIS